VIKFKQKNGKLILIYNTNTDDNRWVYEKLKESDEWSWQSIFTFQTADLLTSIETSEKPVEFLICEENKDGYFHIPTRILEIDYNLYIHKNINISKRTFCTEDKKVSIFKNLKKFNIRTIFIGGEYPNALPEEIFNEIIESIPNNYEKKLYTSARVDSVLKNYFETGKNYEEKLKKYLNKKPSIIGKNLTEEFRSYELQKFELIFEKIQKMLDTENEYNEKQWQEEILGIVLLLYPKYIHIFKNTPVKDLYSNKSRELDFLLVDAGGNIDIIEIKQPFDNCIVTKIQYRDNYIPLRELSGTVMQIEKYLFYLKSWGKKGEDYLTEKYSDKLPQNFKIQITNPSGIIIMGREKNLSSEQRRDFEVIKRQYKNVIDIITYDDLVRRLWFMIRQLQKT